MTMPAHDLEFEMAVSFDAQQVTLAVRGEVDMLTAPTLHAAMKALVEQGGRDLVLDLGALRFLDASGLKVIADISSDLAISNRILTIRSAPAITRHILGITGLIDAVRLETSPDSVALGTQQRAAAHFLSGARIAARNDAIDAALRRVTALVHATLEGADGVSVTLERDGQLSTVAASNDTVVKMDHHQYETGEGPCLSAAGEGRGFHITSLADETRWPEFVPRAIAEGIASILSTPLLNLQRSVGALNIYSNTERVFGPRQQELAELFAAEASGILTAADDTDVYRDEHIAAALVARQTIARAQGVLMEREHLSADDAAAAIHRAARAAKVVVAQQAASIVASTRTESSSDT